MAERPPAPPELHLRPAAEGDAALLLEIFCAARREEFAPLGWTPEQLRPLLQQQFAAQARHYATQFPDLDRRIVRSGDADAGYLYVHRDDAAIRLVDIALLPRFRGGGIGGRLVGQLQAEAHHSGRAVRLTVAVSNVAAQRLYRRLGFVQTADDGAYLAMEWKA
ncbi:MAG: GNAT family N-acetyltransferase [Nevskia sp.]|nr:GNAT family N-acetyltransferase [Nevskia sp.]